MGTEPNALATTSAAASPAQPSLSLPAGLAVCCLAAAVITIVIAWPVMRAPATWIYGTEIAGRHHDPFTVMWRFETGAPPAPYRQPLVDDVGVALARVLGPVAAFNVIVLLSFPLTAAVTYALARYLQLSTAGAIAAALLFAFAPVHVAHAAYHPHIAQVQWMPLLILALWACLDRASVGAATMLAASAAGLALSNFYGAFIAALVAPVALVAWWLISQRTLRPLFITVLTLASVVAAAATVLLLAAPTLLTDPRQFGFDKGDLARDGARWWAYVVPPSDHFLLGSTARRIWERGGLGDALLEQQLFLGWAPIVLASVAIGTSMLRPTRQHVALRHVPVLVCVALWAALCSLAPEQAPGGSWLPVPAVAVYDVLPMFRSYARFGIVTMLMVALLAGIGVSALLSESSPSRDRSRSQPLARRQSRRILASVLLAIAAIEFVPLPWRARDVLPTPAHRWLAEQPVGIQVLDCVPPRPAVALVPWLMRRDLRFFSHAVPDCSGPDLPRRLAALGYTHVIARRSPHGGTAPSPQAGLTLVQSFENAAVLLVNAEKTDVVQLDAAGFHALEHGNGRSWCWMGQQGAWILRNATGADVTVVVDLELAAFAGRRRLVISIDTHLLQTLSVEQERRTYRLDPISLPPGDHHLIFEAAQPPTVANAVLGNGDPRALSVMFEGCRGTVAPIGTGPR